MFTDFLYLLRRSGLKVSLTEWMSLMQALRCNLHDASFTGFYHLCRCVLVKSEADFDRFDRIYYMDSSNARYLRRLFPEHANFLPFLPYDVADPWYSGDFSQTWQDIETGCKKILSEVVM